MSIILCGPRLLLSIADGPWKRKKVPPFVASARRSNNLRCLEVSVTGSINPGSMNARLESDFQGRALLWWSLAGALCLPCSELTQSCVWRKETNGQTRHGTAAGAGLGAPPPPGW